MLMVRRLLLAAVMMVVPLAAMLAPVAANAATGSCHVTYAGNTAMAAFSDNVTIASTGSSAINGWTLTFTFPGGQKITNFWNAAVTQSGASVTATNMSWNATIAPGSSTLFGIYGTWTTSNASPTNFALNGTPCT
jgi:cellulase/cellobiase CelA1